MITRYESCTARRLTLCFYIIIQSQCVIVIRTTLFVVFIGRCLNIRAIDQRKPLGMR